MENILFRNLTTEPNKPLSHRSLSPFSINLSTNKNNPQDDRNHSPISVNLPIIKNKPQTYRDYSPISVNITADQNNSHTNRNLSPISPNLTTDQNRPTLSPFSLKKTTLLLAKSKKCKFTQEGNKKQGFYCVNSLTQASTSDVSYITKKNTINVSTNNTPIKKRKKRVDFVANYKLVTKIYYDPNEPLVNMNKKNWEENKNKEDNKIKDDNKDNLKSQKTFNNEINDRVVIKENVLCSCFIY